MSLVELLCRVTTYFAGTSITIFHPHTPIVLLKCHFVHNLTSFQLSDELDFFQGALQCNEDDCHERYFTKEKVTLIRLTIFNCL